MKFAIERLSRITCTALAIAACLVAWSGSLYAQGSPYDFIGFGDPVTTQSPRMEGLAGAGVASTESRTINDMNPAAWSMLTRARIEARLGFAYDKSDLGSSEGIQRIVKFSGASFATALWEKQKIGFALGFAPLTNADAQTQQTDTLGTTIYKREGGLSQLYIGLSVQPVSALNIGARADFLFGNLRTISQADVSQGLETSPGVFQREYSMAGFRGTFGFLLTLDTLFSELKGLTIGGAFSTGSSLSSKQRTLVTPINSSLDSTIETVGYGYYPALIRLGIATRFGDRYRAEADISGQDFSTASFYSLTSTVAGDPNLGASNRYSFGVERLPIMGEEAKGVPFWERTGIRLGGSYATLPFRPSDLTKPSDPSAKTSVTELSFSAGLGLPLNLESLFDFSVTLGVRNPAVTGAAPKEFFFKMGASISLSEKWFVPLRREDD
ncbi:MAG: hypothetical protein Q8916_09665 [Bacteroidota bacterium]|nr:hypothetical protein [Bacteroidota bacterium]MDP4230656.1 hypothetical protein [Bacteroidota bacterium]MDP4235011.1 hypothetical protein [Bacteroidota bacterium]